MAKDFHSYYTTIPKLQIRLELHLICAAKQTPLLTNKSHEITLLATSKNNTKPGWPNTLVQIIHQKLLDMQNKNINSDGVSHIA